MPIDFRARQDDGTETRVHLDDDYLRSLCRDDGELARETCQTRLCDAVVETLRGRGLRPTDGSEAIIRSLVVGFMTGTSVAVRVVPVIREAGRRDPPAAEAAGSSPARDEAVLAALRVTGPPLLLVYDDHTAARERLADICRELGRPFHLWTRADGWQRAADPSSRLAPAAFPLSDDANRSMLERQPAWCVAEAIEALQDSALEDRTVLAFQDLAEDLTGEEQVLATAIPSLSRALEQIHGRLVLLAPTPKSSPSWAPLEVLRFRTGRSPTPLLDRIGRDLTALARNGALQRISGRDRELDELKMALRTPPGAATSPLLYGAKGTGKSAILEHLAIDLSEEKDTLLRNFRVISVSAAALAAGTSLQGALEARVEELIEEAEQSSGRIVLILDEIHAIAQSPPALEALKEPLARGRIRLIGATTPEDWDRVEVRHEAFASRFMKIRVEPLGTKETVDAMRKHLEPRAPSGLGSLAQRGRLVVDDGDLEFIAQICGEYLPQETAPRLPISVLYRAVTSAVQSGADHIGHDVVLKILSDMTGARLGWPSDEESQELRNLEERLRKQIYGQDRALGIVARAVVAHRLRFAGDRPTVLMFVGPTGTGKTELAKEINRLLTPGQQLITFNMETYGQEHTAEAFFGAPSGYVGFEEGGQLVNLARKFPYRVVLLDEVEKAHKRVVIQLMNILYEGRYVDRRGLSADFRGWLFCLTTNAEQDPEILRLPHEQFVEAVVERFARPIRDGGYDIPREVLSRISEFAPFPPLTGGALKLVAFKKIGEIVEQAQTHLRIREVTVSEPAVEWLCGVAEKTQRGARALDQLLTPARSRLATERLRHATADAVELILEGDQLDWRWT